MSSAAALFFCAGILSGSLFNIRTLVLAISVILFGSIGLCFAQTTTIGLWTLTGIVWVEVGYLAGVYVRSILSPA